MSDIDRYYAAACQIDLPNPTSRDQIMPRVRHMLAMIDRAVGGYEPFFDVRLVVFPEFAHAAPVFPEARQLYDRLAVPLPGEWTDPYVNKARELGIYIQTGTFLERDDRWPGHVFNTTCLIGPEGLLAKYRKVHPWLPWEVHTSPHDLEDYDEPVFPVVETPIGRLGAAICYDWLFPEAIRQLALAGAEVLVRVSAYMDPWGTAAPLDWWTLVNRTRALENMAYVVASNQASSLENYPPFSWPGGSMIVDFDGRILSQADPGPGEKIIVGPIDLASLRHERARRRGHNMLRHLRTEAYPAYEKSIYPSRSGGEEPQTALPQERDRDENETTNDTFLEFLAWAASGCRADEDTTVANVEYRLLCSGVLKPVNLEGDWTKSDIARRLLATPVSVVVASQPMNDYPQELTLRFPFRWGNSDDVAIASDLAALLTVLTRRLVTVYAKTRTIFNPQTTPEYLGLKEWKQDWPAPIANAKPVVWSLPARAEVPGETTTTVQFHAPCPVDVDRAWIERVLLQVPEWQHRDTFIRAARLYSSAMEHLTSRVEASYQLLISATEAMAGSALKSWVPSDDKIIEGKKGVLKKYTHLGMTRETAQEAILISSKDNHWSRRKFVRFLMQNCDWASISVPDDLFLVLKEFVPGTEESEACLKTVYDQRSSFSHSGYDYPASAHVGVSNSIPSAAISDFIAGKQPFPPIVWFERVVNNALLNFLRDSLAAEDAE